MIRGNVRPQGQEPVTGWPEIALSVASVAVPTYARTMEFLIDAWADGDVTVS